jgi:Asp/Glu/hydantoin racemase
MAAKYRFLLIPAFRLPENSRFASTRNGLPKEQRLMNFEGVKHLLADVEWDMHEGALATYGDWAVENREEFLLAGAARLPIVREACESGKYNALVLLGGGEPGYLESREIARKFGVAVTSCASSQMHVACMLGSRFSVIDPAESHNLYYADVIVRNRFQDRCASIRNINYPHPRPSAPEKSPLHHEKTLALKGERSPAVERAVEAAVAAIEEDGAEVITFGCSGIFWLKPFVEQRLKELGWEVPVLEGYSCAISLAKMMIDLGVDASGLAYPSDRPKQWRRKKLV